MNWGKGYSAKYYMTIVDPNTWKDIEVIDIIDGSINKTSSDLRESADINCIKYKYSEEKLVRVWLDAKQNGSTSHTAIFTGYGCSPSKNINGNRVANSVQCYSILKPAQDILLPRGWYAPKSTDTSELLRELLRPTRAPIDISKNAPILKQALIAEQNENNLSMADLILATIGWRLRIYGDGSIHIDEKSKTVIDSFDYTLNDILEPSIRITYDWYNCPNVLRAVVDDASTEIRDDDPNSIFSTVSRGREIWAEESNCDLKENESIAEYATRRLKELQQVALTMSYDRRFKPDIYPTDIVSINYPAQNITGAFRISSQNISLGYNAKTSEEATRIQ